MGTGANKINIFLKKFLSQQQITENFLEYLRSQAKDVMRDVFPEEGFLLGGVLSAGGSDRFTISTPLIATDGLGNRLAPNPVDMTQVQFENALGIDYSVGLRYNQIPSGTEINVRTGEVEYTFIQEAIGELAEPDLVTDLGATIEFRIDSVTEVGVSNAGRKAKVWLKRAVGQADAFFEGTVTFSGGFNKLTTTNLLGQNAGDVSTDPSDYEVFLIGPTVKRNTDLDTDPAVAYVGIVTGAGSGNAPSSFDQSGQNLIASAAVVTTVNDEVKAYLTGGGLIEWDLTTETLSWAETIETIFPHQSFSFQVLANSVVGLGVDECLYYTRDTIGGTKTLTKVAIGSVPSDANNFVVAIRRGNNIYFKNGSLELKGDASGSTSGRINDITQDLLDYMGATDESDADPNYPSVTGGPNDVITQGDNLTIGISKLHNEIVAINTNNPGEYVDVGDGITTLYTLPFLVDPDNAVRDLEGFVDGRRQNVAADGNFDQPYKNFRKVSTTQVEFAIAPPVGRVIVFWKQGTSYGGPAAPSSGNLWSDPMDASQIPTADAFHDVGSQIRRIREGHFQSVMVNTLIEKTDVGDVKGIKVMVSAHSAIIPAGKPVAQTASGILPADTDAVLNKKYIGITMESIAIGGMGRVLLAGSKNVPGVLTGLGFAPGDDIYVGETPGTYTNDISAFSGFDDDIIRIGIADSAEGTASAMATDLILMTDVVSRA